MDENPLERKLRLLDDTADARGQDATATTLQSFPTMCEQIERLVHKANPHARVEFGDRSDAALAVGTVIFFRDTIKWEVGTISSHRDKNLHEILDLLAEVREPQNRSDN